MDNSEYYLLVADESGQLTGGRLGPYDKRTVVGMHIKKLLLKSQLLIDQDGERTSVEDLIRKRSSPDAGFEGARTGVMLADSISNFLPTWVVTHLKPKPHFAAAHELRGLGELRVQPDVIRLLGPQRQGISVKTERIKIEHERVVNLRMRGDRVDLLLTPKSPAAGPLEVCTLEFLDAQAAADFDASLPARSQTLAWPKKPWLTAKQMVIYSAVAVLLATLAAFVGGLLAR